MQSRSHALPRSIHVLRTQLSLAVPRRFPFSACCSQPRRLYSRRLDSSQERQNIAILGGGITGLATAHYLTKTLRNANITVYEANPRLGGWLQSQRVEVPGGSVLFEQGPRTIRQANSSLVTTHLVALLPRSLCATSELALANPRSNSRSKTSASSMKSSTRPRPRLRRETAMYTTRTTWSRCLVPA